MTAITVAVDNYACRTTLAAEDMVDAETEKRGVIIGNQNTLCHQTIAFGPIPFLIRGTFPHRG